MLSEGDAGLFTGSENENDANDADEGGANQANSPTSIGNGTDGILTFLKETPTVPGVKRM